MRSVNELIVEVDGQNDQITRATATISDHVHSVQGVLESFDRAALENEGKLSAARTRGSKSLELTASAMFDEIVKAGLVARRQRDGRQGADASRARSSTQAEDAIADGRS